MYGTKCAQSTQVGCSGDVQSPKDDINTRILHFRMCFLASSLVNKLTLGPLGAWYRVDLLSQVSIQPGSNGMGTSTR